MSGCQSGSVEITDLLEVKPSQDDTDLQSSSHTSWIHCHKILVQIRSIARIDLRYASLLFYIVWNISYIIDVLGGSI
jgi:hypothetical protein